MKDDDNNHVEITKIARKPVEHKDSFILYLSALGGRYLLNIATRFCLYIIVVASL